MDKSVVHGEKLSRFGLREGQGVSFMLKLLKDRLNEALDAETDWDFYGELKLAAEWIELICISAFRANAFFSSIQVILKDLIRSETLNNLNGSEETKKQLRLSHFATPKIFGPLSAKFEPYVHPSSHSHHRYLLFSGSRKSTRDRGGSSYDYGHNYSNYSQQKRYADSSWQTPRNKSAKLAKSKTRLVPPQEVLNRSRGETKKFQQNFQKDRGKGKGRHFQDYRKGFK